MVNNYEYIGDNKYRQTDADQRDLKTFRANYDYKEIDPETNETVGEGSGDTVYVEAENEAEAGDIAQENTVVQTESLNPDTRFVIDDKSHRRQGIFPVAFAVVKGKYGREDNTVLESGSVLYEDAKNWMKNNKHLAKSYEEMRVVEEQDPEHLDRYNVNFYHCNYCNKKFNTERGLNIHTGHVQNTQ